MANIVICEKAKSCRIAKGQWCEHKRPHEFNRLWFMDCPGVLGPCLRRGKRLVEAHCVPVVRRRGGA